MAYERCPHCAASLAPPLSSGWQVCGRCGWVLQASKATPYDGASARSMTVATGVKDRTSLRKLLSVLCHASLFLSLVGLVLMILLWQLHPDEVVQKNAKEALNFHITLWFYMVCLIPIFLLAPKLAVTLFCLIVLGAFLLPVIAMLYCLFSRDTPFTYPFILHIL